MTSGALRAPDLYSIPCNNQTTIVGQGQAHPPVVDGVNGSRVPNWFIVLGVQDQVGIPLQEEPHRVCSGCVCGPDRRPLVDDKVAIFLQSGRKESGSV